MEGQVPGIVSCESFKNALLTMPILTAIGLILALCMKKGINGSSTEG
jgi:hypothetical protein